MGVQRALNTCFVFVVIGGSCFTNYHTAWKLAKCWVYVCVYERMQRLEQGKRMAKYLNMEGWKAQAEY